eukprot:TRINITY_DN67677_c2_g1_i1.p1 TRINITY_DN67677_c2_g1~~TRINITY_DN67677_c2_g1_i1.p1  ORF type:complete len:805 (+),score=91.43 TRINITY_DN67677_c2_g1_i1:307-2415(+)
MITKSKDEEAKSIASQNLVDWATRFHDDAQYSEFAIAVQRLKTKGYALPPPGPNSAPHNPPPPPMNRPTSGPDSVTRAAPGRGGMPPTRGGYAVRGRGPPPGGRGPHDPHQQQANAGNVEQLMITIQQDLRRLEMGLQDPSLLQASGIMEVCKRHRNKIVLMLQTDIKEEYTLQLIALNDQISEYLELASAICEADRIPGQPAVAASSRAAPHPHGHGHGTRATPGGPHPSAPPAPSGNTTTTTQREAAEPVDSEEMKRLEAELAKAKASRRAVEEQCDNVRQKINDTRVQLQMTAAPSTDTDTKATQFKHMLKSTTNSSVQVLRKAQDTVRRCRSELQWIRSQAAEYIAAFEHDLQQAHDMADKLAKKESKGFELLKKQYLNEMQMRKKLYNKIQEFRGNTRIYCRARPLSQQEKGLPDGEGSDIVGFPSAGEVILKDSGKPRIFEVDAAFKPSAKNAAIFEDANPIVQCAIDGYNVAFMCYGQSGAGKTFTMFGNDKDPGIVFLGIAELWATFKARWETEKTHVMLAVMDLHGDTLTDSMDPSKNLTIQKSDTAGIYVDNLTTVECFDENDCIAKVKKHAMAKQKDPKAAQLVYFHLLTENVQTGTQTNGKLYFIDLPGSERNDKMCTAMGNVLEKMQQNAKADQIPFKSSKFTMLLQDCMGPSGKRMFFLNVSPAKANLAESANTLAFGFKVRGVILGK